MAMGTCLEAFLDLHVDADPTAHINDHWSTLSKWSLNKCYAVTRSLDRAATDPLSHVTAGWPDVVADHEEAEERECADAGTRPIVVHNSLALLNLTEEVENQNLVKRPTLQALCAAFRALEAHGRKARVL